MPERLEPINHADWRQFGHQHIQRYRFALERIEGSRVLDLACGVGYGSYVLSQASDRDVIGLDLDPAAIAYGHAHYERPGLRLLNGDALKWRNDGAPFDTIVSFETIEHLPDPVAFVAHAASLLKPGGLFLVSAPNTLQFKQAPEPIENEFHLNEPDYATLCAWLQPHFTIEAEWEQSPVMPPGLENISGLSHEAGLLHSRWWLRAANRLEGGLRTLLGRNRPPRKPPLRTPVLITTDIFPLLPERRAACEVFLLVCRRRAG
ncbi:MAG: class I SAM-dependent methyltransferase [Lacunisphaera sp.]|nr:class I SAM-dependent methyltransferase [Lacunisphaera sp.]